MYMTMVPFLMAVQHVQIALSLKVLNDYAAGN